LTFIISSVIVKKIGTGRSRTK